ncbi:MAG: ABC transporter ATP-binding protein [Planctomycetes bacterium]|nr:ABC transporter ATP-binding protein [Planctomycetota bacterium]
MLVELKDVVKIYRDSRGQPVPALHGLSISVAPGEFVALRGPSGCGKSTLLNIVGCLDRPDSGSYRFDGEEVGTLPERRRAELRNRRIGFVFQAFHLLPFLSISENVALPFLYTHDGGTPPKGHVEKLLESVGLEGVERRFPGELSGGQEQRVAIARALVLGAELILADEPTGNLDAATAQGVLDLFGGLVAHGKTVLLVTHDASVASRAGRQVHMEAGRIVEDTAAVKEGRP